MEDPLAQQENHFSRRRKIIRDAVVLLALTVLVLAFCARVDAFELIWELTRSHDNWELDELFVALLVLPASMSLFTVRRWQDLRQEMRRRIAIQAELVQSKESAQAANRAKNEFLANMSHEIRTPLNGVLGMTQLTLETDLSDEQREFLTTAAGSAHSLVRLLNDILDFSKIEAGRLDLEEIDFHLHDHLCTIAKAFAADTAKKGLELVYSPAADMPEWIKGDPARLRQVLTNLLSNAVKFTKCGEIVLKVWTEKGPENEPWLHFSVADTGTGISKDKQELIFEAFRQADGSTTREYGGSGLGLAICSRLVDMMGGELSAQSEPGEGSRFYFSIPYRRVAAVPQPPAIAVDLAGMRVLVVDDNATNRRIVLEYLRRWGMSGNPADSGAAALAMLNDANEREEPYQLVVVDAMMPQMDGFELCQRIGEMSGLQPVLLMLSSLDLGVSSARCRDLGISQYVVKPVARDELLQAFCNGLELSRGGPPPAAAPVQPAPAAGGLSILLAEDNPVNQLVAVHMLERQGHLVEVVPDGEQALEALRRGKFDLLLMDVQMPNLDGLGATERIRQTESGTGEHLPIIALTAHALKGDREQCLEAGMDGYLTKPLTPAALRKAISVLSREYKLLGS